MWRTLHKRLKSYVPLMIGTGSIILVIDILVLFLNHILRMDKGTALYFSILIVCVIGYLMFCRQLTGNHTHRDRPVSSESTDLGNVNDGMPRTTR